SRSSTIPWCGTITVGTSARCGRRSGWRRFPSPQTRIRPGRPRRCRPGGFMKVFISADMEGTAGVTDWDQVLPQHPAYARFRRLMTEEVNAAILGALEAGAKEIVVNDSHNTMRNLLIEELHPQAQLMSGAPKPHSMMQGIDASFDLVFFTGYHAAAGTQNAILDHSYSSLLVRQIKLGNLVVGEAGLNAGLAGHFKVPVALVTGDATAVAQAKKLLPQAEAVAVKEAVG